MDIRVLRYFLAVAREESISRAADVLHITQPTLSRQMMLLEDELGAQLLVTGRKAIFNEISSLLGEQARMNIRGYVNLVDNALPLVENSDWGCLTIDGAASYLNSERVVFRPFVPEITSNTVLAWRKYGMSFGVASAFLTYIKQAKLRQE